MSRVNGKKPPVFEAAETEVTRGKYQVGCGASLGGYRDQGVPNRCGAVMGREAYLCRVCSENAQLLGMAVYLHVGRVEVR